MKKRKQYEILATNPITGETLVTSDIPITTKAEAKDMVSIFKLVNPSLVYKIQLKETTRKGADDEA